MSRIARRFYRSDITVWPQGGGYDEYGRPAPVTPYTIKGMWEAKSETKTDDVGSQFVTRNTFHFEMARDDERLPVKGDRIALGVFSSSDPSDTAEIIKMVEGDDVSLFGNDLPDWRVYT